MTSGARALNSKQGNLFDAVPVLVGTASRARADRVGAKAEPSPFVRQREGNADRFARPYAQRESLVAMRARLLNSARQRVFGLVLAFGALTLVGLVQIAWQGFEGAGSTRSRPTAASLIPPRAELLDRNGVQLALAYPSYSLYFYPKAMSPDGVDPLVRPADELARDLKAIFPDLDEAEITRKLEAGEATRLRKRILPEEANAVWALGELALQSPQVSTRHYPQGRLASHVIGRVTGEGEDQTGLLGMEAALDGRLSDPDLRAAPVALSIDARVQGVLEDEMDRGMKLANAAGAAGVVLDVDTGEVIALASLPDFDPNRGVSKGEEIRLNNRVTYEVEELGSVFKPVTVAAAIDAGVVSNLQRVWDATPVKVGRRTFKDFEDKGDALTVPEALAYSSNTVTMRIAEKLGGERLRKVWLDLGMNRPVDIEIGDTGRPDWPKGKWSPLTTKVAAYGHGFNVSPLHLANAYAAMVNGGIMRPATLLKVEPGKADTGTRVFKASTSLKMRQLLRLIAKYGTGKNAHENAPGFRVGGKTGSAEKLVDGRYSPTRIVATFAAAFPMDRPRYVVVISLDEPKITHAMAARTAYFNAAPIAGNLIRRAGPMLGVRPDKSRDVDTSDLDHLLEKRP
ncbi:MAG: penicillin-binding protein 2 [Pseudomonadota bacterium]